MHKLFDNTFITAVQMEITTVDVMPAILSRYTALTTSEVAKEANFKTHCDLTSFGICTLEDSTECLDTVRYLENSRRWIGAGEISVIVNSMILTKKGIRNYVVTDDKQARRLMDDIHEDPLIEKNIGFVPEKIEYTGTVGLICHLKSKGLFDENDCKLIKNDLIESGFRITPKILECLG